MSNLVVFLDSIGRVIAAEKTNQTEDLLVVHNPAVVVVSPDPSNQRLTMQMFPLLYRELQGDKSEKVTWRFNKKTITAITDTFKLDERFQKQYEAMFAAPVAEEGTVIKLDE